MAATTKLAADEFKKWFPLANKCWNSENRQPVIRLLCFHGAGSDSQMFVTKGTARNPMPNPLLEYCIENQIELLPVHLPGRTLRLKEAPLTSAESVGRKVVEVLHETGRIGRRDETKCHAHTVPLCIAAHSMGCLCAFELMKHMRRESMLPTPRIVFFSCMVSPDIPPLSRPWKISKNLDTKGLQQECREWSVNEVIFEREMWQSYESIIRSDFRIFDEYPQQAEEENQSPLGILLRLFCASKDHRATSKSMLGWEKLICGTQQQESNRSNTFKAIELEGTHGIFYDAKSREQWMEKLIDDLDMLILDMDYTV